jgi:cell division protein ZapA (FtsZ GTPase activity inhibitor)
VDEAISEMQGGAMVESHKAAILAALRIAGELFEARDEAARLAAQMRELSDEIRPWLPPAKRHD